MHKKAALRQRPTKKHTESESPPEPPPNELSSAPSSPGISSRLVAASVGALSFLLYLITLPPTVVGGDSGEIVVSAWTLALPHPPGYPLITLIGHIFSRYLLPLGEPAWRMGVLNAIFSATSSSVIHLTVLKVTDNDTTSALAASCLYSISPLNWQYAITPEVFALNNLMTSLLLYILALHCTSSSCPSSSLYFARLGALVSGLSLANQHTSLLFVLPCAAHTFLASLPLLLKSPKEAAVWTALLAGGLVVPYAIIACLHRTDQGFLYSWGDLSSASGILKHLLRREYGTFDLISGHSRERSGFARGVLHYVTTASRETCHLGPPSLLLLLALLVVARISKRRDHLYIKSLGSAQRRFITVCSSMWTLYVGFFFARSNLPLDIPLYLGVIKRFHMQPNAVLFVFLGLVCHLVAVLSRPPPLPPILLGALSRAGRWGVFSGGFAAIAYLILSRYPAMDQSKNVAVRAYAVSLLKDLPEGSILLTKGDLTVYPTRYVQACLGMRGDVSVMDQEIMGYEWYIPRVRKLLPQVSFPPGVRLRPSGPKGRCKKNPEGGMRAGGGCLEYEGVFNLAEFFSLNYNTSSIFIVDPKDGDSSYARDFVLEPHALIQRVVRNDERQEESADELATRLEGIMDGVGFLEEATTDGGADLEQWESLVRGEYHEGFHRIALALLHMATSGAEVDRDALERSNKLFRDLLIGGPAKERIMKRPTWSACKNAAIGAEKSYRLGLGHANGRQNAFDLMTYWNEYSRAEGAQRDPQWKTAMLHIEALRKEIPAVPGWSNVQTRVEEKAGVAGLDEGESGVHIKKKRKGDRNGKGNLREGGQKKEREKEKEKERGKEKKKKEKGKRKGNGKEEGSLRARLNRHCQRLYGSDQGQVAMCVEEGKGQLAL